MFILFFILMMSAFSGNLGQLGKWLSDLIGNIFGQKSLESVLTDPTPPEQQLGGETLRDKMAEALGIERTQLDDLFTEGNELNKLLQDGGVDTTNLTVAQLQQMSSDDLNKTIFTPKVVDGLLRHPKFGRFAVEQLFTNPKLTDAVLGQVNAPQVVKDQLKAAIAAKEISQEQMDGLIKAIQQPGVDPKAYLQQNILGLLPASRVKTIFEDIISKPGDTTSQGLLNDPKALEAMLSQTSVREAIVQMAPAPFRDAFKSELPKLDSQRLAQIVREGSAKSGMVSALFSALPEESRKAIFTDTNIRALLNDPAELSRTLNLLNPETATANAQLATQLTTNKEALLAAGIDTTLGEMLQRGEAPSVQGILTDTKQKALRDVIVTAAIMQNNDLPAELKATLTQKNISPILDQLTEKKLLNAETATPAGLQALLANKDAARIILNNPEVDGAVRAMATKAAHGQPMLSSVLANHYETIRNTLLAHPDINPSDLLKPGGMHAAMQNPNVVKSILNNPVIAEDVIRSMAQTQEADAEILLKAYREGRIDLTKLYEAQQKTTAAERRIATAAALPGDVKMALLNGAMLKEALDNPTEITAALKEIKGLDEAKIAQTTEFLKTNADALRAVMDDADFDKLAGMIKSGKTAALTDFGSIFTNPGLAELSESMLTRIANNPKAAKAFQQLQFPADQKENADRLRDWLLTQSDTAGKTNAKVLADLAKQDPNAYNAILRVLGDMNSGAKNPSKIILSEPSHIAVESTISELNFDAPPLTGLVAGKIASYMDKAASYWNPFVGIDLEKARAQGIIQSLPAGIQIRPEGMTAEEHAKQIGNQLQASVKLHQQQGGKEPIDPILDAYLKRQFQKEDVGTMPGIPM
jgi:hypothetical protein